MRRAIRSRTDRTNSFMRNSKPKPSNRLRRRCGRRWQRQYNQERPHQSLEMKPPASLYRRSRRLGKKTAEVVYPKTWPQRRVRRHGEIKWQGRLRSIGEAFIGCHIDLRQPPKP